MRYSVLGGAVRVSVPAHRSSLGSRPWLLGAARQTAMLPSRWATSAFARQAVTVLVLGSAALAAGALVRGTIDGTSPLAQLRELKGSVSAKPASIVSPQTSPFDVDSRGIAAVAPAGSSLNSLRDPGYLLARSTTTAIADVRVAVADAALLQQLRTQILAPSVPAELSGGALTDLVSLVRQAQVSSSAAQAAAAKPLDPLALAQSQTAVRAAQQELAQATQAESEALSAALPVGSASGTTVTPDAGALTRMLESRLAVAQQRIRTLLIAPSPDVIAAAQKAVTFALAATPPAPDEQRIAEAKNAVGIAQKQFDAASQPLSAAAMASARADAEGRGTPTTSSPRGQSIPAPVADPGEKPLDAMSRIARGPDPQRVADTKTNLDNAKLVLATLEQQAAYASSPEIQPTVIEARKRLASLLVPPDPAAVADAQATVVATQQQLENLRRVASSAGPAATATATTSGLDASGTSPSTTSTDPVSQARQRLIDAQNRLRAVVVAPSDGAVASNESDGSSLPTGSTSTRVTPEILAAQNRLASTLGVSRNDLTAVQVELRARYVSDIALRAAHLHPAALSSSLQSSRADGLTSRSLGWPVLGTITQLFGVPELGVGAPHTGVDIGVPVATPVLAAASGVIGFAGGTPGVGYGYYAVVEHGLGVSTLYAHLALLPFLHAGQSVAQGGLLGLSGSTGVSTGPHLHFEVRYNGSPVDPLRALPPTGR